MPPSRTAGRQEMERKKLASSAGWMPYFAAEEEEGHEPELGPSKRARTESKTVSELASSTTAAVPMSVAQAIPGPGSSNVVATVKESAPATTRTNKRKRVAPAHLRDGAKSSGATKKSAARSKKGDAAAGRTVARKKKTITKGKGKGKVVQKTKGRSKGKRKKKAAVTETSVVSSAAGDTIAAPTDDAVGGGGQEEKCAGSLDIARADVTQQAADAQLSPEGGPSTIDEERLRFAQHTMDVMAVAASRMSRLPTGIGAVLLAFTDETTEADTGCVEGAAAEPGGGAGAGSDAEAGAGAGVEGGAGAGDASGAGAAGAGIGAAGEAVGGYGGEAFGDFDDGEL